MIRTTNAASPSFAQFLSSLSQMPERWAARPDEPLPVNAGKLWWTEERERLKQSFQRGDSVAQMASAFGRSRWAIVCQLDQIGCIADRYTWEEQQATAGGGVPVRAGTGTSFHALFRLPPRRLDPELLLTKPPEDLTCSICWYVFEEPVRMPCGHFFCRACKNDLLLNSRPQGSPAACPLCRASFVNALPDASMAQRVQSAVRRCGAESCHWYGNVSEHAAHVRLLCPLRYSSVPQPSVAAPTYRPPDVSSGKGHGAKASEQKGFSDRAMEAQRAAAAEKEKAKRLREKAVEAQKAKEAREKATRLREKAMEAQKAKEAREKAKRLREKAVEAQKAKEAREKAKEAQKAKEAREKAKRLREKAMEAQKAKSAREKARKEKERENARKAKEKVKAKERSAKMEKARREKERKEKAAKKSQKAVKDALAKELKRAKAARVQAQAALANAKKLKAVAAKAASLVKRQQQKRKKK